MVSIVLVLMESALTLWLDLFSPLQALHGDKGIYSCEDKLPSLSAQSRIINGKENREKRYAIIYAKHNI